MILELVKNNDDPSEEKLDKNDDVMGKEELGVNYFDRFLTRGEVAHHEYLISAPNSIYDYFMIMEDTGSVIYLRMSPVVLGKPFVELSNMIYDSSLGLVKFTTGDEEIAYKMPHNIE
nr:MAK10-like protein [Tanacetum cinerariifolium]